MGKPLYKTTLVIWSEFPPEGELVDLAYEATEGHSYCSVDRTRYVAFPELDPDWDGNDFFVMEEGLED